jgi:hypothetical protein
MGLYVIPVNLMNVSFQPNQYCLYGPNKLWRTATGFQGVTAQDTILLRRSIQKPTRMFMLYSRVTSFPFQSVSPGVVETEFLAASGRPVDPKQVYSSLPHLEAKDIADAVLYVLGVPPHVQVLTGLVFRTFRVH